MKAANATASGKFWFKSYYPAYHVADKQFAVAVLYDTGKICLYSSHGDKGKIIAKNAVRIAAEEGTLAALVAAAK